MLGEKVVCASISPCLYILSYMHTKAVLPAASAAELNGVRLAGIFLDGRNITLPFLLIVLLVSGFMHFFFFFRVFSKTFDSFVQVIGYWFLICYFFLFEKSYLHH